MADGATTGRSWWLIGLGFLGVAGLTVLLLALLTNIFERKQEARQPFVRLVEVTEDTMDPKVWGQNWPAEYDRRGSSARPSTSRARDSSRPTAPRRGGDGRPRAPA
jgi:hypothetical protein